MYDPITISRYGQERHQEIVREAEAYWKARLIHEEREQSGHVRPARHSTLGSLLAFVRQQASHFAQPSALTTHERPGDCVGREATRA